MNSRKMKLLRGKHSFKNYQELCAALEIDPAKRGSGRDKQKEEIRKEFFLTENKNGTYSIEKKTKADRAKATEQKKIESGQIVLIDGQMVDLKSTICYRNTHIDDYIEFMATTNYDKFNTKRGFVSACFSRTKLFKELLAKENIPQLKIKYNAESLHLVQEYTLRRLSAMLDTNLRRMEKAEKIEVSRGYVDDEENWYDEEEIKPFIEDALKFVGLKSEFQVYMRPYEDREIYHRKRNELFRATYGGNLKAKRLFIEPLVNNDDTLKLNNKDIQIILTSFFDIFRAKVRYDITNERKNGFGDSVNGKRKLLEEYGDEALEIIDKYCAYTTTPGQSGEESVSFYSLEELEDYYDEAIAEANSTLVFSGLTEYSDEDIERIMQKNDEIWDERDAPLSYDEVNGDSDKDIDYYALENIPF